MLHLDTGNSGFMLLCTSLVMLMTPGLAFFYGGLVGRRGVLTIMMQSFVSMGWTTVVWFIVGYSLCFSGGQGGIIGNLDMAFLRGVTLETPAPLNDTIPLIVFVAYQMMFAIITPALITGAFVGRVTFTAYMLFLTGWLLLVYFPFVHMIWGGGWLAQQASLTSRAASSCTRSPEWPPSPRSCTSGDGRPSIADRTAFLLWRSGPGSCGSGGMASMPAASSGWTQ
jgi:ammonia channel protein AmtB